MELIDFSPEIFKKIIKIYVDEAGIRDSWLRRDKCRTFAEHITEETVEFQSIGDFVDDGIFSCISNNEANLKLCTGLGVYCSNQVSKLLRDPRTYLDVPLSSEDQGSRALDFAIIIEDYNVIKSLL
ncbi:hypothetical protein BS50DRAFT_637406 [Corynespora cassiicola Philippines]|uniref:Uncharacterized protein n=1 Tax=Corynespora cassiicola Philippines TaxID=1448308 RepID=A0A2T2NFA3_CORCC|nr:hypothetical protein BS50DRAFT_637406 [Corynespora cassiicola Philippines]